MRTKHGIIGKYVKYCLIAVFVISHNNISYSIGRLEMSFYSSDNGYAVSPDYLVIMDINNTSNTVRLNGKGNHYTAVLPDASYVVTFLKSGYELSQTYFTVDNNILNYRFFVDPLVHDHNLSPYRIMNLLKPEQTLILGYVVDDHTGEALKNVVVKYGTEILSKTDYRGYFELYRAVPQGKRLELTLSFELNGYQATEYRDIEITPNTDIIFRVRMRKLNQHGLNHDNNRKYYSDLITHPPFSGFVLPLNIRVGRNCTATSCTTVEVYSLQTYCKYVLPAEVYSCWGNLTGGMNSLQANAVAVRTYGTYHVYNPISSNYDICDNTYCQYMGNVQSTNTNQAVDNTYPYILTNSSGVVRSEYSAENNNRGCGNGYSGTGSSWPCIYDPVCINSNPNGHGRGLCQWGSVRWATGRVVTTSSPCTQGNFHSYGTKTWQQILEHYYKVAPYNWNVTAGTTAVINQSSVQPQTSNPCTQITVNLNVTVNNNCSLIIGTSIAPTGTTNWISDPQNDVKKFFQSGTGNYSRVFFIPCNVQAGTYDLYTALWYDKNNNSIIDGGDFVVSARITPGAFTVSPVGINPIKGEIPAEFALHPNYPNPFNASTKIRFDLPVNQSNAILSVYDLNGQEVFRLANRQLDAGSYEVYWNAMNYPSGVYIYSLITDDFTASGRMVLVK